MERTQACDVCGTFGYWREGRIEITGEAANGPPRIGRCPRCQRSICEDHGEVLRIAENGRRVRWGGRRVVCCPFDPGVPLGT